MMNYDNLIAHKAKAMRASGIRKFVDISDERKDYIHVDGE